MGLYIVWILKPNTVDLCANTCISVMEKNWILNCFVGKIDKFLKGKNVWNGMSYLWLDDTAIGVFFQMAYLVIEAHRCFYSIEEQFIILSAN